MTTKNYTLSLILSFLLVTGFMAHENQFGSEEAFIGEDISFVYEVLKQNSNYKYDTIFQNDMVRESSYNYSIVDENSKTESVNFSVLYGTKTIIRVTKFIDPESLIEYIHMLKSRGAKKVIARSPEKGFTYYKDDKYKYQIFVIKGYTRVAIEHL